jgi:hypothetical protein
MITQAIQQSETQTGQRTEVRAVSFEAHQLDELSRQVTGWLMEHPSVAPVAFSHAAETRPEIRNPVSLAGPEARVFYTGILLVQA